MTRHQAQRGDRATVGGFLGASLGFVVGLVVGLIVGWLIAQNLVAGSTFGGLGYLLWLIGALIGGAVAAPVGLLVGIYIGAYIGQVLDSREEGVKKAEFTDLLERAFTEVDEGDWNQAVTSLTEVIRLNPVLIEAYHRRALAYLALNELDRAIADSTRVIQTDRTPITRSEPVPPYVAEAYVHRGSAFARTGQHDKAIADFTEAIQLSPGVPTPYEWRARSRRAIGDTKGAVEDELKAHDLANPP
jgi:tetratricopeptide (TPR) repeat protein